MGVSLHVDNADGLGAIIATRLADAIRVLNGLPALGAEQIVASLDIRCNELLAAEAIKQAREVAEHFNVKLDPRDPETVGSAVTLGDQLNLTTDTDVEGNPDLAAIFGGTSGNVPPPPPQGDAPSTAVAAPSTSVPAAPPATSPTPQTEIQRDKNGLPWDERIHSGSRAMNKDGSWRARKGVAEALVTQVEAELRAGAPASVPAPPAPPASAGTPPPPPAGDGLNFGVVVSKIHGALRAEQITKANLAAVMAEMGLGELNDLVGRPDLFQPVLAKLGLGA